MKPTFFISSTIKDFKDLRSSIKWWLEENGYGVNASEYNDFDKPLDDNSYESCLRAIDRSDYFILLIGDRVGGMYDDKISITQMEYNYAYSRVSENKIKLINFIRQDTATRMELLKASNSVGTDILNMPKEEKQNHQILQFVQVVRRVEEMKNKSRPKNNWLHYFDTFSDILSTLKNELGYKIGLSFKAKRRVIADDLAENLRHYLTKDAHYGLIPRGYVSRTLFEEFKMNMDDPYYEVSRQQKVNLSVFYVSFWQNSKVRTSRLEQFLNEGFFLEYRMEHNDYIAGDLHTLASSLLNFYNQLNGLHTLLYKDPVSVISKLQPSSSHRIESIVILNAIRYYEALENCINFSKALYKKLYGEPSGIPATIQRLSIYPDGSLETEEEKVNREDVLGYFLMK